jgi:hypothetical protein
MSPRAAQQALLLSNATTGGSGRCAAAFYWMRSRQNAIAKGSVGRSKPKLDSTASWSLSSIVIALVVGNFTGGMALILGLPMLRGTLASYPEHPARFRAAGGALTLVGVAGWVVPWVIIIHWLGHP